MGRMKKGQPGHEEAVNKWRQSMLERYGSEKGLHEAMRKIGAKGGTNGHTGGFASDPERARICGAKGGKISRRGATSRVKEIEAKRDEAIALLDMGISMREVARRISVNYSSFTYWVKTRLGDKNV